MTPLISLVSGTYNRLEPLARMIDSFVSQIPRGTPFEVIIVDGGSTDGTQGYIKSLPYARLIEGDLDGAIKAFNTGAAAAQGRYVLLANDDVYFFNDSIVPAIMHLERTPYCGAVAFADNRPKSERSPLDIGDHYSVGYISTAPPPEGGYARPVPYAQVGLFRKELGDRFNWWGYGEIDAKSYGGDTLLSARIWEAGYSVDAVKECVIHDTILEDELRRRGRTYKDEGYYKIYPAGFSIADEPAFNLEKAESLRIAYLPIFENHAVQQQQKHGLRDALNNIGWVWELDYNNHHDAPAALLDLLRTMQPHLVVTQFHGADKRTNALATMIKQYAPRALFINWNGDYWPHGLTSPETLALLRSVDLQLTVNADVLPFYEQHQIAAAYWQVSFEPVDETIELPELLPVDVVFCANNNAAHGLRSDIEAMLERLTTEHGITYALYGNGWQNSYGDTMYNFALNRAIYQHAKIAISDTIPGANGFVSDRFWQICAAGGAVCLQQHIDNFETLTGYKAGVHYYEWSNLRELEQLILMCLQDDRMRMQMGTWCYEFTHERHSFDNRVIELLDLIENLSPRRLGGGVLLMNVNTTRGGGVKGDATQTQYLYHPGQSFEVDSRDARLILQKYPDTFRKVQR